MKLGSCPTAAQPHLNSELFSSQTYDAKNTKPEQYRGGIKTLYRRGLPSDRREFGWACRSKLFDRTQVASRGYDQDRIRHDHDSGLRLESLIMTRVYDPRV